MRLERLAERIAGLGSACGATGSTVTVSGRHLNNLRRLRLNWWQRSKALGILIRRFHGRDALLKLHSCLQVAGSKCAQHRKVCIAQFSVCADTRLTSASLGLCEATGFTGLLASFGCLEPAARFADVWARRRRDVDGWWDV